MSASLPRLVVVDACNVGHSHCFRREYLSARGVVLVLRHFLSRGHKVSTFIPLVYKKTSPRVIHPEILEELESLDLLAFTPARRLHDKDDPDRHPDAVDFVMNYDDLFTIQRAHDHYGVVVSNDRFSDITANPDYAQLHSTIERRRLAVFFSAKDSLRFEGHSADLSDVLLCRRDQSPAFECVEKDQLVPSEAARLIEALDSILRRYPELWVPAEQPQFTRRGPVQPSPHRRRLGLQPFQLRSIDDFLCRAPDAPSAAASDVGLEGLLSPALPGAAVAAHPKEKQDDDWDFWFEQAAKDASARPASAFTPVFSSQRGKTPTHFNDNESESDDDRPPLIAPTPPPYSFMLPFNLSE